MWTDKLIKAGQQDKKALPKITIHSILNCTQISDYAFKIHTICTIIVVIEIQN